MPRDLSSSTAPDLSFGDDGMVASPESRTPKQDGDENAAQEGEEEEQRNNQFTIHRDDRQLSIQMLRDNRSRLEDRNELHPYVQTLSLSDLQSCIHLEEAIFPPPERCTPEKFTYRLRACPELSLGLFSTISTPPSDAAAVPTYSSAKPTNSASPSHKQVLIAMVVATKTSTPFVTDPSMDMSALPRPADDPRGHHEGGRTICVHSFGVLPAYQKRGLGKILMKSYQQRMESSGIADRLALLSHEPLLSMYKGMGFEEQGKSDAKFGGGGWTNMIYEFADKGFG